MICWKWQILVRTNQSHLIWKNCKNLISSLSDQKPNDSNSQTDRQTDRQKDRQTHIFVPTKTIENLQSSNSAWLQTITAIFLAKLPATSAKTAQCLSWQSATFHCQFVLMSWSRMNLPMTSSARPMTWQNEIRLRVMMLLRLTWDRRPRRFLRAELS